LAAVDHGQHQHVADGWATVETSLHDKPDAQLKSWLNEDSLFVDGPGHSELAPGQLKRGDNAALNNQGTLGALDSTLSNFISLFTKRIEQARNETQGESDGPNAPGGDGGQTTQDGQGQQGGTGGSDTPASRPGPVGCSSGGKPTSDTPPSTTTSDDSGADNPKTNPSSAPAPTGDKVDHSHVTARGDSTNLLIIAPVPGAANTAAANSTVNPAQSGEPRAADSPLAGMRPAALLPDLAAAPGESASVIVDSNV